MQPVYFCLQTVFEPASSKEQLSGKESEVDASEGTSQHPSVQSAVHTDSGDVSKGAAVTITVHPHSERRNSITSTQSLPASLHDNGHHETPRLVSDACALINVEQISLAKRDRNARVKRPEPHQRIG